MTGSTRSVLVGAIVLASSCAEPGASLAPLGAQQQPDASAQFFAVAVEHLAREASGRLLVDPRPLRPGADLAGVQEEDLLPGATEITRLRADVLSAHAIMRTDAPADQRCTFSEGIGLPAEREALLADSTRQRMAECRAREPYTTLIFSLPHPAAGEHRLPGTWHIEAVAMDRSGFRIWDLYLRIEDGRWRVTRADARFTIWS